MIESTKNALIGYSGLVGSSLLKQNNFDNLYRSTNISDISDDSFDTIVCAGAPAVKWLANTNPTQDKESIDSLTACRFLSFSSSKSNDLDYKP